MSNQELLAYIDLLEGDETNIYAKAAAHDILKVFEYMRDNMTTADIKDFVEAGLVDEPEVNIQGYDLEYILGCIDMNISEAFQGMYYLKKYFHTICCEFDYEPRHTNW